MRPWIAILPGLLAATLAPAASTLDFSDPAKIPAPPAHAIGFPSRDAGLDALPGFQNPPPGYGEVAFYWWLGDPLTKERLAWQLDQLALVNGVMGLQINYAHSDRGGSSYGLTFPSEPPLFSPAWWDLTGWFMGEAKKRGMAISLSDYTLGVGQGWSVDDLLRRHPELQGASLQSDTREAEGGQAVAWNLPASPLCVNAYRVENGQMVPGSAVDLQPGLQKPATVSWTPPPGRWRLIAVSAKSVNPSLDPMHPRSGPEYARSFFGQFEDHLPGEGGRGLNFFFSDELEFRLHGRLWNDRFADEFQRRKGYDVRSVLPALFADIGPETPKVRLDYNDVQVALTEAGFFKPVFDWHQQRGMIYGCDHGGRGRNVVEFGDYFRTQRWNQGPGCDQPGLGSDVTKNKVASSIAHLYQRPRVWLEGYYGSGWGTSTAQLTEATFRNFIMGQNLLTLHGLYYSTHGGWWEWAPPCNHFRMPYWPHMRAYFACVQRLSYLLSQGDHRCDVAILYPVAPVEAGLGGTESVQAAFRLGEHLYRQGLDFDFMDFESLDRAKVADQELRVSGERYRVLVLPAMKAIRWSTLQKAAEFARGGGLVIALGALPEASDRAGRSDPQLDTLVQELFVRSTLSRTAQNNEQVADLINRAFPRDFACTSLSNANRQVSILHRRIGPRDLFAVHGAPAGTECAFRATGRVELWDPWTGQTRPLRALAQTATATRLALPLSETEMQLIVFSPGQAEIEPASLAPAPAAAVVQLEGPWEFELQPTLDNRFGDFRWPPTPGLIGPEARRFRYAEEAAPNPGWQAPGFDDTRWPTVTASFGPGFWLLGPLPDKADLSGLESQLAALRQIDPAGPVEFNGQSFRWRPYDFSWRWGVEKDPGHQGYHGLKEEMSNEFIALGRTRQTGTGTSYERETNGSRYYLWTAVNPPTNTAAHALVTGQRPAATWLNHARLALVAAPLPLKAGPNPLLLRYDAMGRCGFVVQAGEATNAIAEDPTKPFATAAWIWTSSEDRAAGERFFCRSFLLDQVPAHARLRITCDNRYDVYLNGIQVGHGDRWETVQEYAVAPSLRRGTNHLKVTAYNGGDAAGLIAELTGPDASVLAATDTSWLCARTAPPGWPKEPAAPAHYSPAQQISEFATSLWATHPLGPPRVITPITAQPGPPTGSLAMTWLDLPGRLPFDTRPQETKPAGWYRFTAPPGLRALTFLAHGKVQAWVDGQAVALAPGKARPDGAVELKATLPAPASTPVIVALRIDQERGTYAGAALPEPIALDCGPGQAPLGDWTQTGTLECYSGGAWYRKTVTLTPEQVATSVQLDLGNLASSAEVRINGQSAGIRVAPPWQWELTSRVKPGPNRVEVLVLSALGGHYTTIPTRYRGPQNSGLLGPVTLHCGKPKDRK